MDKQDLANCSSTNDTDEDDYMDNVYDVKNAMIFTYCFIFVFGVSGNLWVLVQIGKSWRKQSTATNIFVFNLGVADLFLMLCLPVIVTNLIEGKWVFGWLLCKLYFTFDGVNKFASVAFLVLLSVDRYMAVCHPLTSRSYRTTKVAVIMVSVAWLIVAVLMTPVFAYAELQTVEMSFNESRSRCMFLQQSSSDSNSTTTEPRRIFTFYSFTLIYVLPLILISGFYTRIIHKLRRQEERFPSVTCQTLTTAHRTSVVGQRRKRASRRISIMVLMIVLAYTLCWMPYWFIQIGSELFNDYLQELRSSFTIFSSVAYALQISNSALNPVLYALGTDEHRKDIRKVLGKCICCGCRSNCDRKQAEFV